MSRVQILLKEKPWSTFKTFEIRSKLSLSRAAINLRPSSTLKVRLTNFPYISALTKAGLPFLICVGFYSPFTQKHIIKNYEIHKEPKSGPWSRVGIVLEANEVIIQILNNQTRTLKSLRSICKCSSGKVDKMHEQMENFSRKVETLKKEKQDVKNEECFMMGLTADQT